MKGKFVKKKTTYLELFRGAREDGAALLPDGALVPPQGPEKGLLQVGVPQEHPQTAGPHKLVGEEQAEGPHVGPQLGAQETGSLALRLWAGLDGEVVSITLGKSTDCMLGVNFQRVRL